MDYFIMLVESKRRRDEILEQAALARLARVATEHADASNDVREDA